MAPVKAAKQEGDQQRQRHHQKTQRIAERQRDRRAGQGAGDHLPFAADIDHAAAEGHRDADAHEEDGRRFGQRIGGGILVAEGPSPHGGEGLAGVRVQDEQDDGRNDEGAHQGDGGGQEVHQAANRGARAALQPGRLVDDLPIDGGGFAHGSRYAPFPVFSVTQNGNTSTFCELANQWV